MTQIGKAVEGARQAAISGLTDAELLSRFLDRRDEAAFAALVQRHASLVWGVCRRLLSQEDAEDTFQAVFVVLFRRAASIKPRKMVPAWLHGVAHQTSLHARRTNARRMKRERQVPMPEPAAKEVDTQHELRGVLDAELSRLPDHYRAVIVMCDLEGKTRKEAARQLGCPEGTVAGHLARGRAMLARRLRRHGLGVSCGALAALLSPKASAIPPSIVSSTITTVAGGALPAKVALLADGVIKTMLVTKLTKTLALLLVLGLITTATVVGIAGQADKPAAGEKPVKPAAKLEPIIAWGEAVGGLKAGLSVRPDRKAYHHGEMVSLVVHIRNVGKEVVKFQYVRQFLDENPPTVADADGKPIQQHATEVLGFHSPVDVTLEPGKEIELESRLAGGPGHSGYRYQLWPTSSRGKVRTEEQPLYVDTGKVTLQYERVLGNSSAGGIKLDPVLSKLATGKLELAVKDAEKRKQEGLTAWGDAQPNGVQVGLGYLPGERRPYRTGETVTLVVRVRNIGKQDANLEYMREYLQNSPPRIVDGKGKKYPSPTTYNDFGEQTPVQMTLAQGNTSDLYKLKFVLRPASEKGNADVLNLYGTGKFQIQETGLLGNSWIGKTRTDTTFSGMFSGTLEVEVKEASEAFTAWGKEAGGLQAGLAVHPKQPIYRYGDVIRLRSRKRIT
jgi:RNA polymerase sigma factor (sigma-70 family)